ncbi:MAG: T9SS type A sorting domain-containing protein [Bacteroidia bacterium]
MNYCKKNILFLQLLSCAFVLSINAKAQHWQSLGAGFNFQTRILYADTSDNYLYVAGTFYMVDNKLIKGITRWNGVQWDSLGAGIDGLDSLNYAPQNTLAITRFQNKLYVGGSFRSLGNKPAKCIGTWDGTQWDTLLVQPFTSNISSGVSAFEVINNELYVGGVFETVAGAPCKSLFKWNGTTITPLSLPSNLDGAAYVNAICKYNGEIYVGGGFSSNLYPNDTIQCIIRHDGNNWKTVGGGLKGPMAGIVSMAVYNNELYIAGTFSIAEGNVGNYIQKWNGAAWSDVGGGVIGIGGGNGQINKIFVYDNKLYAMGVFSYAGGIPAQYIATWDGTNWCALGGVFDNTVGTGCIYKDTLYVGGGFWTIDGDTVNHIGKWIGGNYVDTCGNTTGITDITKDRSELIVYPNPANGQIVIEFSEGVKDALVEIKNTQGKTIYSEKLQIGFSKNIDITRFPNGIYFVQVQTKHGVLTKKFIKQ